MMTVEVDFKPLPEPLTEAEVANLAAILADGAK